MRGRGKPGLSYLCKPAGNAEVPRRSRKRADSRRVTQCPHRESGQTSGKPRLAGVRPPWQAKRVGRIPPTASGLVARQADHWRTRVRRPPYWCQRRSCASPGVSCPRHGVLHVRLRQSKFCQPIANLTCPAWFQWPQGDRSAVRSHVEILCRWELRGHGLWQCQLILARQFRQHRNSPVKGCKEILPHPRRFVAKHPLSHT